jgi:hypothetical protein
MRKTWVLMLVSSLLTLSPVASAIASGKCPVKSALDQTSGITQARANNLIGMREINARKCAKSLGWGFRVGQRNDQIFAVTFDYRLNRVTFKITKGFITGITVG